MDEEADVIRAAAQSWYGYGTWSAPFWFVGMEQGGNPEQRSYFAWKQLGGGELLDCRQHHLAVDDPLFRRWHQTARPRIQPTWGRLISILLSYKGQDTSPGRVRDYQIKDWGSSSGETAVVELSALRARNLSAAIARFDFREERVRTLQERVAEHEPTFLVCYGLGYKSDYERLAGGHFDNHGFFVSKRTVFALTRHPTSFGVSAQELAAFGRNLRERVRSLLK